MKNSDKILLGALIGCVAALSSCTEGARVSGVLAGAPDDSLVVMLLDVNKYKALDTVKTDAKGRFSFKVPVKRKQPEFIYLFHGGNRVVSLLLQSGERAGVNVDLMGNYSVTGSPESDKLKEVERDELEFGNAFAAATARLEDLAPDSEAASEVRRDLAKQYISYYRSRVQYIMANSHSLTVIPVLYQSVGENLPVFGQTTDAIHFRNVCDSLKTIYPESRYVKALEEEVRRRQNLLELSTRLETASESTFPDIELPDINGKKVKLSDVKSRLVMVYFWSAADAEQKMFNLDVIKPLYGQYRSKGLEIYAVSLDTDKSVWANAVRNQKTEWINVCDGKGFNSIAARLYNVPRIPMIYFIRDNSLVADSGVKDGAGLKRYLESVLK